MPTRPNDLLRLAPGLGEGQNGHVLIVDDEPDVITYYSTLLADNGYATMTAANGEEALSLIKDNPPSLITLDITMPEKSGVKLYREIKENNEWIINKHRKKFMDWLSSYRGE